MQTTDPAHAMVGDRERCLQAGMDGYTSKPLQIQDLLAAIESVLHEEKPARSGLQEAGLRL